MKLKERFLIAVRLHPVAAVLCAAAVGISLLLGTFLGINAATDPYDCRMLPGVTIGGLDVGGMTRSEARSALKSALEESLYTTPLTVRLPKEELILSPEESGVRVSVHKAVREAYAWGRDSEQMVSDISLLPYLKLKEDTVQEALRDYAARWDSDLTQSRWELKGEPPCLSTDSFDPDQEPQTLVVNMGTPAIHLDTVQVYGEILSAYKDAILLCASGNFAIVPEVVPEQLPDVLDAAQIHEEISVTPVSDSLDMTSYEFVPGTYGYGIDPEQISARLEEAGWGNTVAFPLQFTEPKILGDAVFFQDVLGHCETRHTDDENRNTNLRLLCEALDGVILQPGEEFSYNGTIGERTEEKGYKPANAYSGKRLVKDIGGGVCQGSTTLYNCALLADLEILERVCHGAKVGYVPLGLDAAVNWNTKTDLRFKNNFHFPMMLKAEVSDGYVRMQILGTDEKDYYVEMRCGVGEDDVATYAVSYKCKYDKETGEQISKEVEARSTYYELS